MSAEARALFELVSAATTFVPHFHDSDGNLQVEETLCLLIEHLGEREILVDELAATLHAADTLIGRGDQSEVKVVDSFLEDLQLFVSYPDTDLSLDDVLPLLPTACAARWVRSILSGGPSGNRSRGLIQR